jgi:hypothetical protein
MQPAEATFTVGVIAAVLTITGWYATRRSNYALEKKKLKVLQRRERLKDVYQYVQDVDGSLREVAAHLRGPADQLSAALARANEPALSIAGQAMVKDHSELKRLFNRFRELENSCHKLVGEADRDRQAGRGLRDVEDRFHDTLAELVNVGIEIQREGDHLERE